ncbi:MAG: RNA-binding protein [Robiginitomaculum sp.]|nr:MAG: RNA-binding protein [Robiginitomaculum sp.]
MNTTRQDTTLRLDIWLWRARFYKSRAISARTIRLGRIRLLRGGQTICVSKSHTLIRPGDRLVFMRANELFQIEILSIGTRRGPASEAETLFCAGHSPTDITLRA